MAERRTLVDLRSAQLLSLLLTPQPLPGQPQVLLGDEQPDLGVLGVDMLAVQAPKLSLMGDYVSMAKFHQGDEPLEDKIL
jgi:hypothetical protein